METMVPLFFFMELEIFRRQMLIHLQEGMTTPEVCICLLGPTSIIIPLSTIKKKDSKKYHIKIR